MADYNRDPSLLDAPAKEIKRLKMELRRKDKALAEGGQAQPRCPAISSHHWNGRISWILPTLRSSLIWHLIRLCRYLLIRVAILPRNRLF